MKLSDKIFNDLLNRVDIEMIRQIIKSLYKIKNYIILKDLEIHGLEDNLDYNYICSDWKTSKYGITSITTIVLFNNFNEDIFNELSKIMITRNNKSELTIIILDGVFFKFLSETMEYDKENKTLKLELF